MYCIYRITNLINGKTYIGQHKYKELNDDYMGSGKLLRAAQSKYGIENFKKDILVFNISKKEHIDLLEKTFIASEREKFGVENCYNIANGGEGNTGHCSEQTKIKLSEASKRNWQNKEYRDKIHPVPNKALISQRSKEMWSDNNHYDKVFTEETKKKMSEARKGVEPWNKGKKCNYHTNGCKGYHHTAEAKQKISEAGKKRKGTHLSEETKRKLSELNKGKKHPERCVFYEIDGVIKSRQDWSSLGINVYRTPNAVKLKASELHNS